jgi:hypothetical protein
MIGFGCGRHALDDAGWADHIADEDRCGFGAPELLRTGTRSHANPIRSDVVESRCGWVPGEC